MQISFDTKDPREVAAVQALMTALAGQAPVSFTRPEPVVTAEERAIILAPLSPAPPASTPATAAAPPAPSTPPAPPSGLPNAGAAESPTEDAAAFGAPLSAAPGTVPPSAPASTPDAGTPTPSPTGQTAPTGASPSEVDSRGVPWDARIHSGPPDKKPQNADGSWRKKRGVGEDMVAQIEREISGGLPLAPTAPASAPPPPPANPNPNPPPPPTGAPAVMASGVADAGPASDFPSLMRKITARQTAGVLTTEGLQQIGAALGISHIKDLISRADLIPAFDASLPPLPAGVAQ